MSFPFLQPYFGLGSGLQTKNAAGGGGGGIGGWVELARTTLGSVGDTITVSSLSNKRYYMILSSQLNSGAIYSRLTMNNDTGSSYAFRRNIDNGGDANGISQSSIADITNTATYPYLFVGYVSNYSTKEKLVQILSVGQNTAGAANAPTRTENVAKWTNISNAINRFDLNNTGSGDFDTNSEVVVLGWDPADTHSNNFWTELASTTLTGSADTINSGTFTAKKYLWVQAAFISSGGACEPMLTFNGDTGANYTYRRSVNGSESTGTSQTSLQSYGGSNIGFLNYFFVNVSTKEKLGMLHLVSTGTGVGASNVPDRRELALKWTNTSNQITSLSFANVGVGHFGIGSTVKVWGSD